jgi:CBS domain containing-hemolysin-like protein
LNPQRVAILATLLAASVPAHASFLSGETMDTAADVLAWVILILVPIVGIVLFWLVHILPEQIAEKRHHPQQEAIKTLCLLSLVFGGLLWPIAWLWAYTRPVMYRMAYGTEKHESYFEEMAEKARAGLDCGRNPPWETGGYAVARRAARACRACSRTRTLRAGTAGAPAGGPARPVPGEGR